MPYDQEANYNKKSLKELMAIRDKFEAGLLECEDRNDDMANACRPFFNEHLQYVRMKIAERVGKK